MMTAQTKNMDCSPPKTTLVRDERPDSIITRIIRELGLEDQMSWVQVTIFIWLCFIFIYFLTVESI